MRGPEHYREAERLAIQAESWGWRATLSTDERIVARAGDLVAAQVHATLALAAATALSAGTSYHAVQADMTEWRHAAGNQTAAERDQMGGQP